MDPLLIAEPAAKKLLHPYDQVVYLLQGGGALGSYQAGVCQALLEFGCLPDWLVGTSIGAINAAIIAGNKPQHRIKKLKEFWSIVTADIPLFPTSLNNNFSRKYQNFYITQYIALFGVKGFFKPRLINPWLISLSTPDLLSYYDTSVLRTTLEKVIDFDLINKKHVRLTLGAVQVSTGASVHFDNYHQTISPEHIMASAALPPGFPAVKINNEYYWDGGVSSNTPFGVILEEKIPKKLLCFVINLFSFPDQLPTSMMDVLKAKKEFEYASRHKEVLHYFLELHFLQHTLSLLSSSISDNKTLDLALKKIAKVGHPTSLNIIRFHYQNRPIDLVSEDFNFSFQALKEHWEAGLKDVAKALEKPTWLDLVINDDSGASIHEF